MIWSAAFSWFSEIPCQLKILLDIFSYVEFVANFLHVCKNGDPENPDSPLSHCCSSSTDNVHSASMGHLDSCLSEPQLTLVAVPIFDQQVQ